MEDQIGEATRQRDTGVRHGYGRGVPQLTAHPTVLTDRGHRGPAASQGDGHDGSDEPLFAAPGLILVAALAIYEAYHWLRLFPGGAVRPTSILFVVAVAPATFVLSRHLTSSRLPGSRLVARVSASVILVLGLVATFDHTTTLHRVLGSASLVLAVALVALVVGSERSRPLPDHTD